MKIKFAVTYEDGRQVEAVAGPKDFVAFERQYDKPVTVLAEKDGLHFEWIYYFAWSVLHRTGREPADFDAFLGAVGDVTIADDEVAPDPTQPAVTGA